MPTFARCPRGLALDCAMQRSQSVRVIRRATMTSARTPPASILGPASPTPPEPNHDPTSALALPGTAHDSAKLRMCRGHRWLRSILAARKPPRSNSKPRQERNRTVRSTSRRSPQSQNEARGGRRRQTPEWQGRESSLRQAYAGKIFKQTPRSKRRRSAPGEGGVQPSE